MKQIKVFKKKHPVIFWLLSVLLSGIFLCIFFYVYIAYFLPLPDVFSDIGNKPTTKIYDRNGILLYEILQPKSGKISLISLSQIPKSFINATLAAEDINFYSHPGVDIFAIARALFFNIREQRIVSGGSTITQQLVRNILGSKPNRDFGDKFLEAVYSIRLSNLYSKNQILELYINRIYYGNLAYGVQSAALNYFGKNIFDLDLAESALIAGLPQSPSAYNPYVNFDQSKKRQKYVLDQMVKYGFITKEEADVANTEPIKLRPNKIKIKAPHFVHYVIAQLEDQFGEGMVTNGGLSVITTLDYNLQQKAENTISRHVNLLKNNNVTNGALVALDVKTGQIMAWVGSKDYFDQEIDGAVDMVTALRQPGSSIKPLTYLAAFEKGYTPATVIFDIPSQFNTESGPYSPKNYDLQYHGPVRARTALASSFNIPAVKVLDYVGVPNFISFLKKMGIDTLDAPPSFYGLALTLGGGEVRPIDMAQAFNVIANYGTKRNVSALLEVKNSDGKDIYNWTLPEGNYVLGPNGKAHAYQIIDIIKDPLARIPGFGEDSVLEISRPAAVKTGTTRNFKDNWTIGFTPQLLTAVWVGNADASSMQNVSGVDGAAPIWADFMESALQFLPKENFQVPNNLVEKEICALSGKLATLLCTDHIYELFVKGSEPVEYDDYYKLYNINNQTGQIVPDQCVNKYPKASITQKVLIAYPPELQKWAAQNGLSLPAITPCDTGVGYTDGYANGYSDDQSPQIKIDNPANNDEYLIDNILPISDQKIPFRISAPLDTTKVTFYLDGKSLTETRESPFTYLWTPVKGDHSLYFEADLVNGKTLKSPSIHFFVK
jgi:1A family penicillin-binding protein